jgi:DMSO/TMAO reductase YedYZ heme-binding membrane subunit
MELVEYFVDLFIEVYFEVMLLFIPEEKLKGKNKKLAKVVGVAVILFIFILFFFGIYLLIDLKNRLGIIAIASSLILFIAHIVIGIIFYFRKK